MSMIVKIKKLLQILVLFFLAFFIIVISGCGNTPPPGATLTVTPFGGVNPNINSDPTTTNPIKGQYYRVTVTDSSAVPLSGVKVDIQGFFTFGDNISFNGAIITAPNSASSSVTTGNFGIVDFLISAPTYTIRSLTPPADVSAAGLTTGGALAVGTYQYCVTALDTIGETTCSALVTAATTTPGSSVVITWTAEAGASNYRVYGRATGDSLLGLVSSPTFTDVGGPTGAAPPGSNTTGIAVNTVKGSIMSTTGPLSNTLSVGF
jgi:hypothetical protein